MRQKFIEGDRQTEVCRTVESFDGSIEDGIDDIERDHAGANDRAGGDRPP